MDAPHLKTALPGPKAKALIERDGKVVSPSYTRDYPFVIARGEGATVEDVDGNVFLDCAAGIAVNSTGHSHPTVVAAIVDQAQKFLHMSGTDFYYEPQVRLGEELADTAPMSGQVRTFYANSGTEANEAAIKLARYHTKRYGILGFLGSFHGRTMGSLSLTSSRAIQRRGFGPMQGGTFHAPYANCYRCPVGLTPDRCGAECLEFLEEQILVHLISPDDVAAVLVEPIQGEGGYVVPPAGWLAQLRDLCDRHGILLVIDEVQSGVGRTGKLWAAEHDGVEADIITVGKGIASGLPLAALIARADLMQWAPGKHGSTFGGNPVACAAAIATLDLVESELADNAATVGEHLMGALRDLAVTQPAIEQVRGRGLMIGIELPSGDIATAVERACFDRGLLVLTCGAKSIRMAPPLVVTREQADVAIAIFADALASAL